MKTAKQLFADIGYYQINYNCEDENNLYIRYRTEPYHSIKVDFRISKIDNNHSVIITQGTWPDICETELELLEILYPIMKQLEEYNIDIKDVYIKENKNEENELS